MSKKYLSLLISTIGIIILFWVNYGLAKEYNHLILNQTNKLDVIITRIDLSVKITLILISLIGIIIGLINFRFNKVYNGIGIFLSVLLILLPFLPLWLLWVK